MSRSVGGSLKGRSICGLTLEDYLIQMEEFHGARSPGMLLGGLMVDLALEKLGNVSYLNVVSETVVCLPDAVQLLTSCTIGNGFLQVLDWGKFALTAYDRKSLAGVRVWLRSEAVADCPPVSAWFLRGTEAREKPRFEELAPEILAAAGELLAAGRVSLSRPLKSEDKFPTGRCPGCGESYALRWGPNCPACQGQAYCFTAP